MRLVTGGAHSRHPQALFEQALAVDGKRVVGEDLVLGDLPSLGDLGALLMTGAAQRRDIHRLRRRPMIQTGEDIVHTVTVGAVRRQLISLHCSTGMDGSGLHGSCILVAVATDFDLGLHRIRHGHIVARVALYTAGPHWTTFGGGTVHAALQDLKNIVMAVGTQQIDGSGMRRRRRICCRQDIMDTMADDATVSGSIGICQPVAVGAGQNLLGRVIVTHGAVHGCQRDIVLELGVDQLLVAIDAFKEAVNGRIEDGRGDVQRLHGVVVVAVIALRVVLCTHGCERRDRDDCHKGDQISRPASISHESFPAESGGSDASEGVAD